MEKGNAASGSSQGESSDAGRGPTPRLSTSGSLLGDLFNSKAWDDGERRRVLYELFLEGPEWRPYLSRFVVLIVLSTTLAARLIMSKRSGFSPSSAQPRSLRHADAPPGWLPP